MHIITVLTSCCSTNLTILEMLPTCKVFPARQRRSSDVSQRSGLLTIVLIILLCPLHASALDLPTQQLTPGGVALLRIPGTQLPRPEASYDDKPVAIVRTGPGWTAMVGIPLLTPAGQYEVRVRYQDGSRLTIPFAVSGKAYPEQHLTIANKRKVNPNEQDMARIRRDRTSIANAKRYRHPEQLATRFDLPVKGTNSSSFGSRRFFNKQPRRPHGGMDIAAPTGTPVYAPGDGYVVETGDYFFSGQCIFLGHGNGLQTFYAHLSQIDVRPGELVKRGQKIGEVGATGRVTGPHLHWSVGLNQTWIDPTLFLHPQ